MQDQDEEAEDSSEDSKGDKDDDFLRFRNSLQGEGDSGDVIHQQEDKFLLTDNELTAEVKDLGKKRGRCFRYGFLGLSN